MTSKQTEPHVVAWGAGPATIPGCNDLEAAMRAPTWPVETLRDALEREYDTDAHLSPVVLVSADGVEAEQPRMNLRALHEAQDAGFEPMIQAVFIDFDNVGHRRWDSPEEASKVVGGLADHPALARAAIYTTRAGWRAVYPVSPAIPLDKLPDVMGQPYEHHGVPPYGILGELAAALGDQPFELDRSCRDRNRCYRAPKVMRDGVPTDPAYMNLDALDGPPLDVTELLQAAKPAARKVEAADVDLVRPDGGDLPVIAWAALGIDGHLDRRMRGKKGIPSLGVAIRKQVPWFGASERNVGTHHAVTLVLDLIYEKTETEPQEAADLTYLALAPCIETACRTGTSETDEEEALDELWSMIERHSGVCLARRQERDDRAQQAEELRAQVAQRLATQGLAAAPYDEDDPDVEVPEAPPLVPVIAWGSNYFVLDARDPERPTYYPTTSNANVVWKYLLEGCGSEVGGDGEGPLGLRLHDADGRLRPFRNIYLDYGASATDVVSTHGRSLPYLDVENYTLEIPGATAKHVRPVYDEEVAEWLRLLAGDDHEGLLDWLATCSRLDRPTSALYLQGAPGAGKSFFALCVSSIFGVGYVAFEESVARFNARLAKSPVVFLDEKMETGHREVSGAFRSLVANTEHRVEAKGKDMMTIRGACRVIIASNNADALPLVGSHSEDDMDAIASRIRWIGIDPAAVDYLNSLGGRSGTEDWIGPGGAPGRFARHVRWLELNRDVQPGTRFLVEGKMRAYHELLALTTDRLAIFNAILQAMERKQGRVPAVLITKPEVEVAGPQQGDVLVHVGSLRAAWKTLTKERNTPTQAEVAAALKALKGVVTDRPRGGVYRDKSVYRVPGRYLTLAASMLGYNSAAVSARLEV